MRVVFDVNVLVRFAMRSELAARLIRQVVETDGQILIDTTLVEELDITLDKPRLKDRIDPTLRDGILAFLREDGTSLTTRAPVPTCRDSKDQYLLAIARDGQADFLVTNDKDLLCLSPFGKCEIVTPEEFARRLEHRAASSN